MASFKQKIQTSLWEQFTVKTGVPITENGYVKNIEDNLIPGLSVDLFYKDLTQGSGSELEWKFRAVHSSSALAVNSFAYWKKNPTQLTILEESGFDSLTFEKKLPTGLGGTPPNLDVLLEKSSCVVGVESKFLEFITPKTPHFATSYLRYNSPNAEKCWISLLESLPAEGKQFLDTAQLVKHYFGLVNNYHPRQKQLYLIYVYWEPDNWMDHDVFIRHRNEIDKFSGSVSDSIVNFRAMNYQELWNGWAGQNNIQPYLASLRNRYCLNIH